MAPPSVVQAGRQAALTSNRAASPAHATFSTTPVVQTPSPPSKRRRTALVLTDCCRTCRLRKVKCSGNPGDRPCANCARLELTCSFTIAEEEEEAAISRTTPSHSHTEAGTLRKRAQRACSQCHAHKTKCSGALPRCKRCELGGLMCEYTPAKRRFTNIRFQHGACSASDKLGGKDGKFGTRITENSAKIHSDSNLATLGYCSVAVASVSSASSTGYGGNSHFLLVTDATNLTGEEMLVRRDLLLRHMDAYMDNMYWLPCQGFLHPETTYREIQEGTFGPVVAAALCGITSIFVSPNDSGGGFGAKCSAHVEMYLFHNIYRFSGDLLVLFALSITFNLLRGEFAKVWQTFGIASRLMLGLQVNWGVLPLNQSFIQQESFRRIAWQLFYLDRMLADGYEEYISCRAENMKIALPCAEAAFRENRVTNAERLYDKPGNHPSTINLHGYQLRLIDLRHRIQVTTRKLCDTESSSQSQLDASKIMADINGLQNELTRFHMSLPPEVLLSDQTVIKFMASPERAGYVFLHTHLAISHIDLYRFSLPGQRDKVSENILRKLPREFIARSQKQAVAHAMCLGRFYDAIQTEVDQMQDTGKLELAGGYSTFQMSTHCIHVLLIALRYTLYRGIADVTTAPLWRSVEVDEAHIRFLINSIQRVTRPWCSILHVAQQAYDHNVALVEEFSKTRKVTDQRAVATMAWSKFEDCDRLQGPDNILVSIAMGSSEENMASRMSSQSPCGSTHWLQAYPSPPGPSIFPTQAAVHTARPAGNAPGIPPFLTHARNKASSNMTQVPLMYEGDNFMLPLGELDSMFPNVQPASSTDSVASVGLRVELPIIQQPVPQPSAGFCMAQQSLCSGNAYVVHDMNRQHAQSDYSYTHGRY